MPDHAYSNRTAPTPLADRSGERGVALLVVLWVMAAATMLVMAFNATVRSGLSFVRAEVGLSQSEAIADAGVEIAVARLIDENAAQKWFPDGETRSVDFAGRRLHIRITDPNGLVDLNKADKALLLEFFKRSASSDSTARVLTDQIIAARNAAEKASRNLVRSANLAAPSFSEFDVRPHAPAFLDVGEARRLDGMSAALYRKVAPFLTVYSADGSINPLSAPDEVLQADPKLRGIDVSAERKAFRAGRSGAASSSQGTGNDIAGNNVNDADRKDGFGPAYVIEVESAGANDKYAFKRTVVVAIGLDSGAPYRTIAVK